MPQQFMRFPPSIQPAIVWRSMPLARASRYKRNIPTVTSSGATAAAAFIAARQASKAAAAAAVSDLASNAAAGETKMDAPRVLIIGAGCTGAAAAVHLRQQCGIGVSIYTWEKARGAGGRFTTSRDSYPNGMRADLGAQYASVNPKDAKSMALMESIVKEGGAQRVPNDRIACTRERPPGTVQYRGRLGQSGIVKTMLAMAQADVSYKRRVSRLDKTGRSWTAVAYDGTNEQFDCVFLCVPGCGRGGDNLNKIHGNWKTLLSETDWRALKVPHDCRYSLALWLAPGHTTELEKLFGDSIEKIIGGSNVELAIWQSRKDGESLGGRQVIVLHTPTGARGRKHEAEPRMIQEICKILQISTRAITSSKMITWFQSQVTSTRSKAPCFVACMSPPLILAGDYFTSSSFTGCVHSAVAAVDEAVTLLKGVKDVPSRANYKSP